MTQRFDLFLSYSRNDLQAADNLFAQLEQAGISVFRDQESIREGGLWLEKLQQAVDQCDTFLLLLGQDGVQRWVGAEVQVALLRHFGPHGDDRRLPIFPLLLGEMEPQRLPAFLRLFQGTAWNGTEALSDRLLESIKQKSLAANPEIHFEGCPFVGLDAFQPEQAHLFFGRQRETLEALASFDTRGLGQTVRWLEISGNSGSGKSSLMNAGLLPLIEQGWLFARTNIANWRIIGPMMPGEHPAAMLEEILARTFSTPQQTLEMADVSKRIDENEQGLAKWLRSRKENDTAFLLAIDQFEELFTYADVNERQAFDRLVATALLDPECPLYLLSTVRADFQDRFDRDLPELQVVRNELGKSWSLPLIRKEGLREVISGPARLAGLDVSEVETAMLGQAEGEPGALPLVENALHWLWEQREDGKLSGRLFNDQGGLAGILSRNADALIDALGDKQLTLKLLFNLVKVDPELRQHARKRLSLDEAVKIAGGGNPGQELVDQLAGRQQRNGSQGPLRLITIADGRVNLIHETLIRSKGMDDKGKPQPYWPTLWDYIDKHKDEASLRERLRSEARQWVGHGIWGRWANTPTWRDRRMFKPLAKTVAEKRYLRAGYIKLALKSMATMLVLLVLIVSALYLISYKILPLDYLPYMWRTWLGFPPLPGMVPVERGELQLPAEYEGGAQRTLDVKHAFQMGRYEVTFLQYDMFVIDTAKKDEETAELSLPPDESWGRGDRPVINVSWHDAVAYTQWLSKQRQQECRLPTEDEWEYAARAGSKKDYGIPEPDGSDDIAGKGLANCFRCGSKWDRRKTAPVGQFPPNAWDLHDMHGNVWEWCLNEHHNPENTGLQGDASRVYRGGSWFSLPGDGRASNRDRGDPDGRGKSFGFRVLCSSPMSR